MARPKNPTHRAALLDAATRVVAAEGLGASTASIARRAGVSAGTLFVYFATKADLLNDLYVALHEEMARAASQGLAAQDPPREQLRHLWDRWVAWAVRDPAKRRALAHLAVAEELREDSRLAARAAHASSAQLLARVTATGPMGGVPLGFVTALVSALADATSDDLIARPDPSGTRSTAAFDAAWRAVAG